MSKPIVKYPATKIVHWPSGPVNACDKHAAQLVGLSQMLGAHVGITDAIEGSECGNCVNEEASNKAARPIK